MSGGQVLGYDMGAALALGAALAVPAAAIAEFLPLIEAEMARAMNALANEGASDG